MEIEVSREDVLLDTGGGLKKAGWFFLRDRHSMDEPFVLHNVDVVSTIDLRRMLKAHQASGALATLAVTKRESSRQLLFGADGQLCGRQAREEEPEIVRVSGELKTLAFYFAAIPGKNAGRRHVFDHRFVFAGSSSRGKDSGVSGG